MIQRIQSLFLFCTTIFAVLLFFIPMATLYIPGDFSYAFYTGKVIQLSETPKLMGWNWYSMVLNILIVLTALVTLFLYKKRFLQMRLSIVNMILQLGLLILMLLQIKVRAGEINAEWSANTGFIFPLIGIIFTWLALRGIIKDITILKSFDRIR